jgi:2-methylcitrate dehydratase PrpD
MPSSEVIVDYARSMGGTPEATVVGHGDRLPMAVAALVNGTMSHSIELDDPETHERSYVHPSVAVTIS